MFRPTIALYLAVLALVLIATGCGGSSGSDASQPAAVPAGPALAAPAPATKPAEAASSAKPIEVDVKDNVFAPAAIHAKVGQKITWSLTRPGRPHRDGHRGREVRLRRAFARRELLLHDQEGRDDLLPLQLPPGHDWPDRGRVAMAVAGYVIRGGLAGRERRVKAERARVVEERGFLPEITRYNIAQDTCENCRECTTGTGCPGLELVTRRSGEGRDQRRRLR